MPQSFKVPRSLLNHYCPELQPSPSVPGHPYVFETTRSVLTLFFGWLYTGEVDTVSWYELTELYFLGHAAGCVALMRSSISQLQKACRDDQRNDTELFHYGHISVIEEMVGASSPLSRYVEDTYFNHWRPSDDDAVSDDPSKHPKLTSFFKKLFERSFQEQREGEDCSCCHDYCKYHDHSEAERLASKFLPMSRMTWDNDANRSKHVDAYQPQPQNIRPMLLFLLSSQLLFLSSIRFLFLPSSRMLWRARVATENPCADQQSVSSYQSATTRCHTKPGPPLLDPGHPDQRLSMTPG